jgi:hypothetical protein
LSSANTYFVVSHSLRHPEWILARSQARTLIIQIKSTGIRLLLLSDSFREALAFDEIQFTRKLSFSQQIEQIQAFTTDSLLADSDPKQAFLIFDSDVFTLCPNEYLRVAEPKQWLDQLALPKYSQVVFFQPQPETDFTLIHCIPEEWQNWANQIFSDTECKPISILGGLLEFGRQTSLNYSLPMIFAHVESNQLYIIGLDKGKVLLANRFFFQAENDLLYFFLLIISEMGAQPDQIRVLLSGNLLSGSLGFEKLSRYVAHLEFAKPELIFGIPDGLDALHHYNYIDLVSIPLYLSAQ